MTADSPAAIVFDKAGKAVHLPALGTPVVISTAGTTILYTPAVGNRLRLRWIGVKSPSSNTAPFDVDVYLGAALVYKWNLEFPDVFSHTTVREGAPNETLSIVLSLPQTAYVNFDVEEFI